MRQGGTGAGPVSRSVRHLLMFTVIRRRLTGGVSPGSFRLRLQHGNAMVYALDSFPSGGFDLWLIFGVDRVQLQQVLR